MSQKPASILVLSIIGIILAALGVFGSVFAIIVTTIHIGPPTPVMSAIENDPIYVWGTRFLILVGSGLNIFQLVASIGSIRLRPWARRGMITFAWLAIAQLIVSTLFNLLYVLPKMYAALPSPPTPESQGAIIGFIVGVALGPLFGVIFPACILFFFTRKKVVDAFNGILPASQTNFQVLPPNE